MRYQKELDVYCGAMAFELNDNEHKGDWHTRPPRPNEPLSDDSSLGQEVEVTPRDAVEDLLYHVLKLAVAVHKNNRIAILEFAADAGNCAMIVADICESLDLVLCHEGPIDYDEEQAPGLFEKDLKDQLIKDARMLAARLVP